MMHKPALASSGVFCVPLDDVTRKEKHDIPLLVETCVQEIERRGQLGFFYLNASPADYVFSTCWDALE